MPLKGYACDDTTGDCTPGDAWKEEKDCDAECTPAPEEGLLRINCVYYTAFGEWDAPSGTDFKRLVGLGVNVLSLSFYKPNYTSTTSVCPYHQANPHADLLCPSGGAWNATDPVKLGQLVQQWGDALNEQNQRGHVYISLGGYSEGDSWTTPFQTPTKFANDLIAIHKSITPHFNSSNCKLGFDLDIEDNGAAQTITHNFAEFIRGFRAEGTGLTAAECPMQVDSFSSVYESWAADGFLFDIIKQYGPKGTTVPNGFQYQGLMVDDGATTGDHMKGYWDNAAWNGESILPYTSRVVNFWHVEDPTLFVTSPDNLYKWISENNVSVAWWKWDAQFPLTGDGRVSDMYDVCKNGKLGTGNFVCSNN